MKNILRRGNVGIFAAVVIAVSLALTTAYTVNQNNQTSSTARAQVGESICGSEGQPCCVGQLGNGVCNHNLVFCDQGSNTCKATCPAVLSCDGSTVPHMTKKEGDTVCGATNTLFTCSRGRWTQTSTACSCGSSPPAGGQGGPVDPTDYGQGAACNNNGGTCQDENQACGGSYQAGLCPGPSSWKCCIPPPGTGGPPGNPPPAQGPSCGEAGGTCCSSNAANTQECAGQGATENIGATFDCPAGCFRAPAAAPPAPPPAGPAPGGALPPTGNACLRPLIRYVRPDNSTHFYTTNVDELGTGNGVWQLEGTMGYVEATQGCWSPNTQPFYRFIRNGTDLHYYVINNPVPVDGNWTLEGMIGYINAAPDAAKFTTTLERFYHPTLGDHFYTNVDAEAANIKANGGGYIYQFPAGWTFGEQAVAASQQAPPPAAPAPAAKACLVRNGPPPIVELPPEDLNATAKKEMDITIVTFLPTGPGGTVGPDPAEVTLPVDVAVTNAAKAEDAEIVTVNMNYKGAGLWEGKYSTQHFPGTQYSFTLWPKKFAKKTLCHVGSNSPHLVYANTYECAENEGTIVLKSGANHLDFSRVKMGAGDLSIEETRDGHVDSQDLYQLVEYIRDPSLGNVDGADLNLDGQINQADYDLAVWSIQNVPE